MQRITSKRSMEDADEPSGQIVRINAEEVSVLDSELVSATLLELKGLRCAQLAEQYQDKVNSRIATLPMDIVRYLLDPMCYHMRKGQFQAAGTTLY